MYRAIYRGPMASLSTSISEKALTWYQTELGSKPGPITFSLGKFKQVISPPRISGFFL